MAICKSVYLCCLVSLVIWPCESGGPTLNVVPPRREEGLSSPSVSSSGVSQASSGRIPEITLQGVLNQNQMNYQFLAASLAEIQSTLSQIQETTSQLRVQSLTTQNNVWFLLRQMFKTSCSERALTEDELGTPQVKTKSPSVVTILPPNFNPTRVRCEYDSSGSGWTVILERHSGTIAFNRTFEEYKKGFGDPSIEYWIGNEVLYSLTSARRNELRVEMEDFAGKKSWAHYQTFSIGSADDGYSLHVDGFDPKSPAGDGLKAHEAMKFSTFDVDLDGSLKENCAAQLGGGGGWWYGKCYHVLGTGTYRKEQGNTYGGIAWYPWHDVKHSLKTFRMMIRPSALS